MPQASEKPTNQTQGNNTTLSQLSQERATKSNAIEIPSISLPKGGGALKGIDEKFQVNAANGTSSFSIPLPLSPNRNGFTPQMSLSYNSGVGNGLFGIGWDIDLPAIQRRTDKKLPRYFDSNNTDGGGQEDSFMFSGVEELVPFMDLKKGQWIVRQFEDITRQFIIRAYRPRIEGGFSRIELIYQKSTKAYYWRVTSKENITTFFGYTEGCRIYDTSDPTDKSKVFQWLPEFSFDDKGSWVWYEYKAEDLTGVKNDVHEKNRFNGNAPYTNKHLKRIKYGNTDAFYIDETKPYEAQLPVNAAHFFDLVLDYGEHNALNPKPDDTGDWVARKDPFSSNRACFEMRTYRLCQRVLMFHTFPNEANGKNRLNNGVATLVRSIDFDYFDGHNERPTELTYLTGITQKGYVWRTDGYSVKALPKMTFDYQWLKWNTDVKTVSKESLVHAPIGLSGNYQWVDLYNEGINGILTEQANGWFYKSNLGQNTEGGVQFAHAQSVMPKPSFTGLSNGTLQLQDLDANGEKQLVVTSQGLQGYFDLNFDSDTGGGTWQPFKTFLKNLNLDLKDPNVRMLDVNGDGKPEVVLSDLGAFWWWENQGKIGYDAPELATKPYDEERGASIVFSDQEQRIFLADMSGDGLTDIVRIKNGEICYWANMGYGRFSAKVTMGNSPVFDTPDMFNPSYIQLTDISGTGATDIIYLGQNKFKAYLNFSGNAWSDATEIKPFFPTEQPNKITVTDLLGNGTACIVWSSEMPAYSASPMRYIDLMGGKKPHIMRSHENGFGKKTEVEYKSSTAFYLKDKLAGTPWITKLPFPVQVVSRTIVSDLVTGARFVNRYTYHHGYYDHAEREFRGFGRVDQYDTEDYINWQELDATNGRQGAIHHEPPVLTRTWFHTGAFITQDKILKQYEKEYWYNTANLPLLKDDKLKDAYIDFTDTIKSLTAEEAREAVRACKGMALRQEVFALDGSDKEKLPYSVATHTCFIRPLQPRMDKKNAVFIVLESEAMTFSYEREPEDARVAHTMNLKIDKYAQVEKAVSIVYGRKTGKKSVLPNYGFTNNFQTAHQGILDAEQHKTHVILTETDFTTNDLTRDTAFYRLPLPYQVKTFECQGTDFDKAFFTKKDIEDALNGVANGLPALLEMPYETANSVRCKRLIEHIQTRYRSNDLARALPLAQLESLALPWEAYQLAFTPEILRGVYGDKLAARNYDAVLETNGKYEKIDGTNYWISSGKPIFTNANRVLIGDKIIADTRTAAQVRAAFYVPIGYEDPFEIKTWVSFDPLLLYIKGATDALGNETAVETFDFRTLSPTKLKDINGNFSEVVTDALGMVVATAIYSKPDAQGRVEGDTLDGSNWLFDQTRTDAFFNNPHSEAASLLGNATSCLVYDLDRSDKQPTRVATITRETHFKRFDNGILTTNTTPQYQISIEYSDGLGNIALKKVQAESGEAYHLVKNAAGDCQVTTVQAAPNIRWIGNGRTVLNNKGKPIKQYEPYFSDTPQYEDADCVRLMGVTPTLYYDAVGRNIKTELPDGTLTKVTFNAWEQRSFDQNDTVGTRKTDGTLENTSVWYNDRITGQLGRNEQIAAQKAEVHADTPSIVYSDSLGRPFFSVAHNKGIVRGDTPRQDRPFEEFHPTYVTLDIEGNVHQVMDARNNAVMTYKYDMLGHRLYQLGMDNGERWMLNDCMGKPVKAWDENGMKNAGGSIIYLELRVLTTDYDVLHRPTDTFLEQNGQRYKIEHVTYDAAANGKGQIYLHQDGSGQTTNVRFDFKGNLLESQKRTLLDYETAIINWHTPPQYDAPIYTQITEYDALNRMSRMYNWHFQNEQGEKRVAVYLPKYSERGVLESEDLVVNALKTTNGYTNDAKTTQKTVVSGITYDAKGQRTRMRQNEGKTTTRYQYDEKTFRLKQLRTTRHDYDPSFPAYKSGLADNQVLQQLNYTYDPVGNITDIYDEAYKPVFFNGQKVLPQNTYEYDALYRLIQATGREQYQQTAPHKDFAWQPQNFPISDTTLRGYTEYYAYDAVGNIGEMRHSANGGSWTRTYNYATTNNRLLNTATNNPINAVTYRYDIHGNMLNLNNNTEEDLITWDYRDMIQKYDLKNEHNAYYQYSNDKQRSRKVIIKGGIKEERLYLGGLERYRRWEVGNLVEEIETLHVFEGEQRILIVEDVKRTNNAQNTEGVLYRYQYSNHLGSATLELNGDAHIISYEEYHPYGTTAYHAQNAAIRCVAKRYRYTGMERDEETGLNYHAARFYAVWLGRWVSCDPIGIEGGMNVYTYCLNQPINNNDPSGLIIPILIGIALLLLLTPSPTMDVGRRDPTPDELEDYRVRERQAWATYAIGAAAGGIPTTTLGGSVALGAGTGVATQGVNDAIAGEISPPEAYVTAAAIGGGLGVVAHGASRGVSRTRAGFARARAARASRAGARPTTEAVSPSTETPTEVPPSPPVRVLEPPIPVGGPRRASPSPPVRVLEPPIPVGEPTQMPNGKTLLWGTWNDYTHVSVNGQEYASIGGRLYSEHAVQRMQPSGNSWGRAVASDVSPAVGLTEPGIRPATRIRASDYGRGVSPTNVEYVIQHSQGVSQANGNIAYSSGTVQVITSPEGRVVTVETF
jgi:RHS repeat-associated protein